MTHEDAAQSVRRALTRHGAGGKVTVALEGIPRTVCMVSRYIAILNCSYSYS